VKQQRGNQIFFFADFVKNQRKPMRAGFACLKGLKKG